MKIGQIIFQLENSLEIEEMSHKIRISTFNCHSFIKNIEVINEVLAECDILLIQESFLTNDSCIQSHIGPGFIFESTPAEQLHFSGRPKGGLLVIWRVELDRYVTCFKYNQRIMGMKLISRNNDILIVNVYAPYDDGSVLSYSDYVEFITGVNDFIDGIPTHDVLIAGDFNAGPGGGRFWREVDTFVHDLSFCVADAILPPDTFTFLNPACNSTSWIDHFLESRNGLVSNISVRYDSVLFDHFPLECMISFDFDNSVPVISENQLQSEYVRWDKLTDRELQKYHSNTSHFFLDSLWEGFFPCKKGASGCESSICKGGIDAGLLFLRQNLLKSSEEFTRKRRKKNFKAIPGWNDRCSALHRAARNAFLEWKQSGRYRFGLKFQRMKESRANFKVALDKCKADENSIRNAKFRNSFVKSNKTSFWRQVNSNNKTYHFTKIDSIHGDSDISKHFKEKYEPVLNDPVSCQLPSDYFEKVTRYKQTWKEFDEISESEIINALDKLKGGASVDKIHSSHLKQCCNRVVNFLKTFFNAMISHSYIPSMLLEGQVKPTLKNKFGKRYESSNFRPVMTSSVILKTLELCLEPRLQTFINLNLSQFGFRKATSTTMAVCLFKETLRQ